MSNQSDRPARAALVASLRAWPRHVAAVVIVACAFAVAARLSTRMAYYGAYLVTFAVWMAWFVLTAVEWLRRADF